MINRTNYELFFMDFADGKLNADQQKSLFTFLEANPDLKEEFELFNAVQLELENDKIVFPGKKNLKKDYDEKLIALLEGDLSKAEEKTFLQEVNSTPVLSKEFALFKKTVSVPESAIQFKNKNRLKRGGMVVAFYSTGVRTATAIAASLVIILLGYAALKNLNNDTQSVVAETKIPSQAPADKNVEVNKNVTEAEQVEQQKKEPYILQEKKPAQSQLAETNKNVEQKIENNLAQKNKTVDQDSIASPIKEENLAVKPLEPLQQNTLPQIVIPVQHLNQIVFNQKTVTQSADSDVFTKEELAELNNLRKEKLTVENLAEKGLNRLEKTTDIRVEKTKDEDLNTKYALVVGRFSVSRRIGR